MKLTKVLAATASVLLPLTLSAATLIIPASGTGAGAAGSQWQTELTLHNVGATDIHLSLAFHDENGSSTSALVSVPAHNTVSLADIVKTKFGRQSATGAIELTAGDADLARLAVTSRTFNASAAGEFGQGIPAVASTDAPTTGDLVTLSTPSSKSNYRFNAGLYTLTAANVQWQLVRADGTVAATQTVEYAAGIQKQYTSAVTAIFGSNVEAQDDDSIQALLTSGSAIFYGSAINGLSGDPTYVPGIRVHDDVAINFLGIDRDENGTVDVADANHDGIADQAIDVATSTFPSFFRVVAAGPNGEAVTFELVDAPADIQLVDANGTIEFAPAGTLRGTTGEIKVRATLNGASTILTIPVNFR